MNSIIWDRSEFHGVFVSHAIDTPLESLLLTAGCAFGTTRRLLSLDDGRLVIVGGLLLREKALTETPSQREEASKVDGVFRYDILLLDFVTEAAAYSLIAAPSRKLMTGVCEALLRGDQSGPKVSLLQAPLRTVLTYAEDSNDEFVDFCLDAIRVLVKSSPPATLVYKQPDLLRQGPFRDVRDVLDAQKLKRLPTHATLRYTQGVFGATAMTFDNFGAVSFYVASSAKNLGTPLHALKRLAIWEAFERAKAEPFALTRTEKDKYHNDMAST